MRSIRFNSVQNIRQNLSGVKFNVLKEGASDVVDLSGPTFVPVNKASEMFRTAKFFLGSYNDSAGKAGLKGKKNFFDRLSEKFWQNTWAHLQGYFFIRSKMSKKNLIAEVVKEDDKMLGCYSLYFDKLRDCADVNFFGVNPDIKNSKKAVPTMFNIAERIVEQTRSRGINNISWATNKQNERAFRLFDKFPAKKQNMGSYVDFEISVFDFDTTLKNISKLFL